MPARPKRWTDLLEKLGVSAAEAESALERLPGRWRTAAWGLRACQILCARYPASGPRPTLQALAVEHRINRERVRQIEHTAVWRLRREVEAERLRVKRDAAALRFRSERALRHARSPLLDLPISELPLSPRVSNRLRRAGLLTLGAVTELRERELLSLRNFGRRSLLEIRGLLKERGLALLPEPEDEG